MKSRPIGTTSTKTRMIKVRISLTVVSMQDSFITGRMSQKKWATFVAQKGNLNTGVTCVIATISPMLQALHTSWLHTLLFIMTVYLRGLKIATYQSYPIAVSRKQLVIPKVTKKNICVTQPPVR